MEFIYQARTSEGKLQSGTVQASTRQAALDVLKRHTLAIIFLEENKGASVFFKAIKWERVNARELVAFSRSFASLFDAGVPLVEGLRILADQTTNKYFRRVILDVMDNIDAGLKLSQGLAKYPNVFSEFYRNMVKSGETSGSLQKILLYLADYTERQYVLQSNIRSALLYPIFIIFVFIIVFLIMMVYVIPSLSSVLSQIGSGELPLITRVVLSLSGFTVDWFIVILILIFGSFGWLVYYLRTDLGRLTWDRFSLKLPVFGNIFKTIYQARFADTLSTLVRGGVSIIEAMQITADVVGNSVYRGLIIKITEEVKAGNTIESVVKAHEEFSPLVAQMIAVGERSGKLEEILNKLAVFMESEVDRTIKGLVPLLEPMLIVVLGVGVGMLVSAIILPIYSIILNVTG